MSARLGVQVGQTRVEYSWVSAGFGFQELFSRDRATWLRGSVGTDRSDGFWAYWDNEALGWFTTRHEARRAVEEYARRAGVLREAPEPAT